jgi:ribonucleoside-diphosphate reductase alpha chain
MRFNKNEDLAQYLMINHPELCEDDVLRPTDTLCVRIPVKAPEDSILRTETAIDTLERVKRFSTEWVKAGHIDGANTHNVSATISVKEGEWETVGDWMWNEQEHYNGLSVLPAFDHTYKQSPFEDCDEETYNRLMSSLSNVDLTKVVEMSDETNLSGEVACAGGSCTITEL